MPKGNVGEIMKKKMGGKCFNISARKICDQHFNNIQKVPHLLAFKSLKKQHHSQVYCWHWGTNRGESLQFTCTTCLQRISKEIVHQLHLNPQVILDKPEQKGCIRNRNSRDN